MIKKIISITAVLIAFVCLNTGAQELQSYKFNSPGISPRMSKIDFNDGEMWWGYYNGTFDNCMMVGLGEKTRIPQAYSAATCILAGTKEMEGKTINGISFSFPSSKNISDVKIWISASLPSVPENASYTCQDVTGEIVGYNNINNDQFNEIRFEKPFKIDSSKDVYVGYSFVVSKDEGQFDQAPIFTTGEGQVHTRALMIKCGDSSWIDYMTKGFGDLAIRFLVSGGTHEDNVVNINESFPEVTVLKGEEVKIPFEVSNWGGNGFTSLGFEIDVAGEKKEVTITPDKKITGIGAKYNSDITFNAPEKCGAYRASITLKTVNGVENKSQKNVLRGDIFSLSRKVGRKVLFEEFTATWCGFCPRGAVGLAKAKQVYGDRVVPIAIHSKDEMDSPEYLQFIKKTVGGFPRGHIDRKHMGVDPYFGKTATTHFGVSELIDDCLQDAPKAEVTADATIDGDILTARAEYKFLYTGWADCAIAYVVTEDSIQNDEWWQGNNYSGSTEFEDEPLFDQFVNADRHYKGMVYNEVAVVAKGVYRGLNNSIPAQVTAEEASVHEEEINLGDYPLILDRSKLNLCVFIIDRNTGRIVNADCKSLNSATGIEEVGAEEGEVVETSRFTIDGRKICEPERGINIVRYSNGDVRKVLVM